MFQWCFPGLQPRAVAPASQRLHAAHRRRRRPLLGDAAEPRRLRAQHGDGAAHDLQPGRGLHSSGQTGRQQGKMEKAVWGLFFLSFGTFLGLGGIWVGAGLWSSKSRRQGRGQAFGEEDRTLSRRKASGDGEGDLIIHSCNINSQYVCVCVSFLQ